MASSILNSFLLLFFLLSLLFFSTTWALNSSSFSSTTTSLDSHLSSIRSVCKSTPYPDVCFDSLKLSISINISPNILSSLLQSLQTALSEAGKLFNLFSQLGPSNIIEKQRGAVQDCKDLHQITVSCLQISVSRVNSANTQKLADARTFLNAALTNKNTCLEGHDFPSGPLKPTLVNSIITTYKHVRNSLSILSGSNFEPPAALNGHNKRRRLMGMGFPEWGVSGKDRRILQSSGDAYDPSQVLTVAADGSGNFTTVTDAVNFAPNNSDMEAMLKWKWKWKWKCLETGNRSVVDGWTTFRSATVAVSGDGFLASDITFENRAGPEKYQAVALRINADLAAMYKCTIIGIQHSIKKAHAGAVHSDHWCTIIGYQDTLYVHSFRQFYRECDIYGTIDFIFGNAAVAFQASNIVSRKPMPGQFTVITAQSRDIPDKNTGISIQNCSIVAAEDLYNMNNSGSSKIKSYLGRPWKVYAQMVYIESYIDEFIDLAGWTEWPSSDPQGGLDSLCNGEYENSGPGSGTENRVSWAGYHVMDYYDASNFTVYEFITGDEWLDSTSFPYDDGF
ncbi:hypothetical protein TEA_012778 [Camellia sinensis var. sinensis]|uniref:Pectinesterase n=1 Tax=Camellia sinensis var. sinensis TaxID=542762 RepID=A0A4S4ETY2_CAMSN|nr:hypothetical protein TEA_012778 [Camellia sinensis var. sinensis]